MNILSLRILLLPLILVICSPSYAQSLRDQTVINLGNAVLANLPAGYTASVGSWAYDNIETCFEAGDCYGNNPTTPYGSPQLIDPKTLQHTSVFHLNPGDAVVIIFKTPPESRYFGFTQYAFTQPNETSPIYASLSDTLNNLEVGTTAALGDSVFNQYSAIIWTADDNAYSLIKKTITTNSMATLPNRAVNLMPIPTTAPAPPVYMGTNSSGDTFNMLMRVAMPNSTAAFQLYMNQSPFFVAKISPANSVTIKPPNVLGYANEQSNVYEDSAYETNLNALVADIKSYNSSSYSVAQQTVTYSDVLGWNCLEGTETCNADNHDARYTTDLTSPTVLPKNGFVLVVGVNHTLTGHDLYMNHTVYDVKTLTGLASVTDTALTESSALYFAGITNADDPRVRQYKNLYAYAIAFNCGNNPYCLQIPIPTTTNPIGAYPNQPIDVGARYYVDPITFVRPFINCTDFQYCSQTPSLPTGETEVIPHQSFIFTPN